MDKAITKKKTAKTGKRIGLKHRAIISLAVNDEDREISRLLEIVKKYYSGQKITTAEVYRKIVLQGLMCELEEIALKQNSLNQEPVNYIQDELF